MLEALAETLQAWDTAIFRAIHFGLHHSWLDPVMKALTDPWRNAQAAYYIKGRQGWCAWSTYGPGCQYHACGPPCYLSFLDRARAASRQTAPGGQS